MSYYISVSKKENVEKRFSCEYCAIFKHLWKAFPAPCTDSVILPILVNFKKYLLFLRLLEKQNAFHLLLLHDFSIISGNLRQQNGLQSIEQLIKFCYSVTYYKRKLFWSKQGAAKGNSPEPT